MDTLAKQILDDLSEESLLTFSVRISKKHYDILQEISDVTGKKPAAIARFCLQNALEKLYGHMLSGDHK